MPTPHRPTRVQGGFTLAELLVAVAITAVLSSVLLPALATARRASTRSMCLSQLKQIGASLSMYCQDYDDLYPAYSIDMYDRTCLASTWGSTPEALNQLPLLSDTLVPYLGHKALMVCPCTQGISDNDTDGAACSVTDTEMMAWPMTYMQRTQLALVPIRTSLVSNGAEIDVLHCHGSFHGGQDPARRSSNVLFLDGHAKLLHRSQLVAVSQTPVSY